MPESFDHRSLKASLFRRFLPLIVLTTALITAWAVFGNWFSVWKGGIHWVSSSVGHLRSEASEIAKEAALAKGLVMHVFEHDQKVDLPPGYVLIERDGSAEAGELAKYNQPGLYAWNGKLAYILPFQAPDARKRNHELILIRKLNNVFIDRIARGMGAEAEILMLDPRPAVTATSWKNKKGERIFTDYEPALWEELARLGDGQIHSGSKIYRVPGYARADTVRTFHAFTPIADENGKRIGYFAVILPAAVMLGGLPMSMALSLLCGLAVALLGAALIVRTSRDVARPISALSGRIRALTRVFYPQTAAADGASEPTANEIEVLAAGVDFLQTEMERAQSSANLAALGEMSASLAHEISNPVAVIHALSDELKEKIAAGKIGAKETGLIAAEIKETASRVSVIIRSLLKLSRDSETDGMESCSLKTLVEDAAVLAREQMRKNRIAFTVVGLAEEVRFRCRAAQISQVVLNLLRNSIDAVLTSGERWIRVEVARAPDSVSVAVIDGGPGVARHLRDRLMEAFFTTKPPGQGTGLGLSISKRIVTEHGGRIYLDETSPHTKIVFVLPLDQGASRSIAASKS